MTTRSRFPITPEDVKKDLMPKAKLYNATMGFIPADLEAEVRLQGSGVRLQRLDHRHAWRRTWAVRRSPGNISNAPHRYRTYFDPETGFMRGQEPGSAHGSNHSIPTDSNHRKGEYVEGNAWQWTWFVPHDVPGLIDLFGGRDPFAKKLNELFTTDSTLTGEQISGDITGLIGQYAHGNEPSHHIAYLFNWVEQPWRTQEILHQIMTEFYLAAPGGLIGNEDCGQMSAWYHPEFDGDLSGRPRRHPFLDRRPALSPRPASRSRTARPLS